MVRECIVPDLFRGLPEANSMTKPTRPFGANIRAARLGYHWSERHGAFIRMTTAGRRTFIELASVGGVPIKSATKIKDHRCWWEQGDILGMIPWLANVRRIKRYIAVEVDDAGNIVRSLA